MSKFLFEDFDEVSAKQWKQQIQYDLKGADYNETLVWQSPEGINVKPFYHEDDFKEDFQPIPGQPQSWKIAQEIFIDDENIANDIALDALQRGAEAIIFSAEREFGIETIFKDFPFDKSSIYFNLKFLSEAFYDKLISFLSEKKATVYYNIDLIGNLARTGNWFHNLKKDHEILDSIFQNHSSENLLSVDATLYQNAGANIIQQLAYALAHANEYLNHFSVTSSAVERSLLTFKIATGPNYFFEIAKIRALRKLYATLQKNMAQMKLATSLPPLQNATKPFTITT
tara:strand:- start:111 stop:965 length:855 start_codon:yes stop_codon:yes gene_type:complete